MNDAGISCAVQVIPAMRPKHLQAKLVDVDTIHQRIRKLREDKGLSQESLGKAAGVTYQSVQEWEQADGTAPSRKRLKKVADALGVTEQYLLSGDQPDSGGVREPAAEYQSVSTRALDIARRFDQLSQDCQDHVSAQVDLLAKVKSNGDRARAAQHDVVIKGGAIQSDGKKKRQKS